MSWFAMHQWGTSSNDHQYRSFYSWEDPVDSSRRHDHAPDRILKIYWYFHFVGTVLRMIAWIAYVPCEGIKSDVILWGLEFPGENKRSHTIIQWAKGGLLVYTHEDSKERFNNLSTCYVISGFTVRSLYSCRSGVVFPFVVYPLTG